MSAPSSITRSADRLVAPIVSFLKRLRGLRIKILSNHAASDPLPFSFLLGCASRMLQFAAMLGSITRNCGPSVVSELNIIHNQSIDDSRAIPKKHRRETSEIPNQQCRGYMSNS